MRILFITSTRIGDAVLSSGAISYLMDQFPNARLTIVCGAPAAPIFESIPELDRLIIVRKKPFHLHWVSIWLACFCTRWDQVYDLRGSLLCKFLFADRRIVGKYRDDSVHRVDELAKLLNVFPAPEPRLWLSDRVEAQAEKLMPENIPVLAIGPTANWGAKQWPANRFAELAKRVIEPTGLLPGAHVAVLGAENERQMAAELLEEIPVDRRIDLIGKPLQVAAACIRRSALYVGNDSGLMHIAAASQTPTLGLFGPSSEVRYGPRGKSVAAIRTLESFEDLVLSPDFNHLSADTLMSGLSVDSVYQALAKLYTSVKNGSERSVS